MPDESLKSSILIVLDVSTSECKGLVSLKMPITGSKVV